MKLTLIVDSLLEVNWWIDTSYNTHDCCRGHTGCMMSLGKGVDLSSSVKQKIKVNSSTEGSLVRSHNGMGVVLWNKHFMEAQGYTVEHNKLYQENNSTILMEKNGISLISKRTKRINEIFLFVKYQLYQGVVEFEYRY